MEIVDQWRFVSKIVPADIHDRLLKCDGLKNSAITRFGHDDVRRGKQGLKGEWKSFSGMDPVISRWDWAIEEETVVTQLFDLFKRKGFQRNPPESHQDGSFVGLQGDG
jgi:hypothetical protein